MGDPMAPFRRLAEEVLPHAATDADPASPR
jgi:hypothetical protein